MPSGMVRPRASRAPKLGAGARAEAVENGWVITKNGVFADPNDRTGPCARCGAPHERYGPAGRPLCPTCRGEV